MRCDCAGAVVGNDRLDGVDVLRAGDDTTDGEGRVPLRQIVDDLVAIVVLLRHLGIE